MFQIVYISTARNMADAEIDEILATSRRNNARDGITGLLLYNGRRFLQALEGPPALVERAYERIRADPRHRAAVLLSSRSIDNRQFGGWDMACQRVDPVGDGGDGHQALVDLVDALVAKVSDANLRAQFTSYVRLRAA